MQPKVRARRFLSYTKHQRINSGGPKEIAARVGVTSSLQIQAFRGV